MFFGYADDEHGTQTIGGVSLTGFPQPSTGGPSAVIPPNILFEGCNNGHCEWDGGAIMVYNNTTAPVTIEHVKVDVAGCPFEFWSDPATAAAAGVSPLPQVLAPGHSAIFAQMATGFVNAGCTSLNLATCVGGSNAGAKCVPSDCPGLSCLCTSGICQTGQVLGLTCPPTTAGGETASCVPKTCSGGTNPGAACEPDECAVRVCKGGTNPGAACSPTNCPGPFCECLGGGECPGLCAGGSNPRTQCRLSACPGPGCECTGGGTCVKTVCACTPAPGTALDANLVSHGGLCEPDFDLGSFDTTDIGPLGAPDFSFAVGNCIPNGVIPSVTVTYNGGSTLTVVDTDQILNTGGIDDAFCWAPGQAHQLDQCPNPSGPVCDYNMSCPPKDLTPEKACNESSGGWTCANCPSCTNALTLEPPQTLCAGDQATVQATFSCGTNPLPNTPIKFEVTSGPNAGTTATVPTDCNGVATFSYSGCGAGADVVTASVSTLGGSLDADPVTVTWIAPTLTSSPASQTWCIGQSATESVSFTCNGAALVGKTANLSIVSGPNAGLSFPPMMTDGNGMASWSYGSALAGVDTLSASATKGACGPYVADPETVTWVAPDFQCYEVDHPPFATRDVSLVNEVSSATATLWPPERMCNPATICSADNADCTDAIATATLACPGHLVGYKIKKTVPHFKPPTSVQTVTSATFGTFQFKLGRVLRLLVPAAKSLVAPPGPLPPSTAALLDHYECYQAHGSKVVATSLLKPWEVTAEDEFGRHDERVQLKVLQYCVPTDKNGEGIPAPTPKLLCYRATPIRRFTNETVYVEDQFGPATLSESALDGYCVPVF